jgi:hypothetical protein
MTNECAILDSEPSCEVNPSASEHVQRGSLDSQGSETILQRLQAFLKEREAIVDDAIAHRALLHSEREQCLSMLDEVDSKLRMVDEVLRLAGELSTRTDAAANGLYVVQEQNDTRQRILNFLDERQDVWLSGRAILDGAKIVAKTPIQILGPLVRSGQLEKRGDRSGSMYRLPRRPTA